MFYVIYNSTSKSYLNKKGAFGPYAEAVRFDSAHDVGFDLDIKNIAEKVVGPCNEGEEP